MLLTFGQMTRHQGHFLIYEDDANFARLSKDQDCEGKFIIVRQAVGPGGVPCCVFLALSWNTNETQMKRTKDQAAPKLSNTDHSYKKAAKSSNQNSNL